VEREAVVEDQGLEKQGEMAHIRRWVSIFPPENPKRKNNPTYPGCNHAYNSFITS